jgi:hypothetical protein
MKLIRSFFAVVAMAVATPSAWAGIYTDDLSRCLMTQTSANDRIMLIRWIVYSYAQHPANAGFVSSDPSKRSVVDKEIGELVSQLLTVSCRDQLKQAYRFEGETSIVASFSSLGEMAAAELIEEPAVKATMNGFTAYIDEKKLTEAMK